MVEEKDLGHDRNLPAAAGWRGRWRAPHRYGPASGRRDRGGADFGELPPDRCRDRLLVGDRLTADEEQRLFEYYDLADPASDTGAPTTQDGADGSEQAGGPATGGPATDGAMTRSEERLHVGTEQVPVGRARLRKYVVSETVTRTVPVSHEELRVTREPIADGPPGAVPPSPMLSEAEYEIVLTAERPVVQKDVVPVERVRLDTVTVTGQETVTEEVRREQIELDSDVPVAGDERTADGPGDDGGGTEHTASTRELRVEPDR
jgi:uncharacterized protein (TIGR02271 family)